MVERDAPLLAGSASCAGPGGPDVVGFGPFRLHPRERRLERDRRAVKIGDRALDLLIALIQRAGQIVSKEQLLASVWTDTKVEDSALRVHLSALRRVLGDGEGGAKYITNVTGRGYSFVAELRRDHESVRTCRPIESPTPHKFPRLAERIVGRDDAIREVATQLRESRFVSIIGPGGMGKTTMALAVAHSLLGEFRDDVRFVDLGSLTQARSAAAGVASALGLAFDTEEAAAQLLAYLRDRRTLLILDCCEHVVDAMAPLAERIHRESEGVHLLATSREPLRVDGERAYRLPPLESPPEGRGLTAEAALRFPAVQLFVERALAGGARFTLSDSDAPFVAEICRRLDGIALAIEFAAARVDVYGVRGTAQLLENRFKLLWRGRRTALPRHQTIGALLDWSYNLLSEDERRVLRCLSVFVGPFSLEAAASICAEGGEDAEQTIDLLGSLVEKSLVSVDVGGGEHRYRLLDTTRDYADTKLVEARERDEVARRHALFFRGALKDAGDEPRDVTTLTQQLVNVRAALTWAFSSAGDADLGASLAASSARVFFSLSLERESATASAPILLQPSLLRECVHWMETAVAALDDAKRETRTGAAIQAALAVALMFTRGDTPQVRTALARAITLAERVDEPAELLRLLSALHLLLTRADEHREALKVALKASEVGARIDDPYGRMWVDWMSGTSAHLLGDQPEAERRSRSVLLPIPAASVLLPRLQFGFDPRVRPLVILARATWLLGRADDALRIAERAVRTAAETDHPPTIAISLVYASSVYLWSGRHDDAAALIDRLIEYAEGHSLVPFHHSGLGLRGELLVKRGETRAGVAILEKMIEPLQAERHALLYTVLATALAEGLAADGGFAAAISALDAAIASTEHNGGAFDVPEMLRVKGLILSMSPTSDSASVDRCLLDALESARRQHALGWELRIAITMARTSSKRRRRSTESREILARVYGQFTQGFETTDLIAAKKLLSEA